MMSSSCYTPLSSFDSNLILRLFQAYVGSMCIHAGRWEACWEHIQETQLPVTQFVKMYPELVDVM